MHYSLITTTEQLNTFCEKACKIDAIAVDTEFVRTRTLYPQLGLVQIYDGEQLVLIDPLSISDFSSLIALFTNPNVVKVMHSCSEDLETFLHALKIVPTPIFDTQFAAAVVGMGPALGYAKLVETMLGVSLDKGETRTDWIARPLRESQLDYAANDVLYLLQLYPELRDKTIAQNKQAWVFDEIHHLAIKKQSLFPTELAYLNIKHNWQLSGKSLLILKNLAQWRMETARQRDLALNFVVREQNLLEVAKRQPKSEAELKSIEGLSPHEVRINGRRLLDIVAKAEQASTDDIPHRVERLLDFSEQKNVSSAIRKIAEKLCVELDVPIELLCSKRQIGQLIKWCWFEVDDTRALGLLPDLINGWRREYFLSALATVPNLVLPEHEVEGS